MCPVTFVTHVPGPYPREPNATSSTARLSSAFAREPLYEFSPAAWSVNYLRVSFTAYVMTPPRDSENLDACSI